MIGDQTTDDSTEAIPPALKQNKLLLIQANENRGLEELLYYTFYDSVPHQMNAKLYKKLSFFLSTWVIWKI